MHPTRAWYAGRQTSQNDIVDAPPERYVCAVSDSVASRARYAGRVGLVRWRDTDVFVAFFVDPVHRHVFAQSQADVPGAELAQWQFGTARAFARWVALKDEAHWTAYIAGHIPDLPPVPLSLPHSPEIRFAAEWQGWTDWLREPRSPKAPAAAAHTAAAAS